MFCQKCGTDVQGAFCQNCGNPVAQPAQAAQPAPQFNPQNPTQPVAQPVVQAPIGTIPPQFAAAPAKPSANPFPIILNAGAVFLKILTFVFFFFDTVMLEIDFFYTEIEYYTYFDFDGREEIILFSIIFLLFAFIGILGTALGFIKKLSLVSAGVSAATSIINIILFLIPFFIVSDVVGDSDYMTVSFSFAGILVIIFALVSALASVVSALITKKGKLV